MSSHNNYTRQASRNPNNSYAGYGDRVNMDIISSSSPNFPPFLNESIGVDPWWWTLQDRILTLPSPMMSFPRPRMQLVVFRNNLANDSNLRPSRPMEQSRRQYSELSQDDQRKAFGKLKKEIYNPIPKKIIQRLGRFYKQNDATKTYGSQRTDKQVEEEDDDDDKKCVICLEEFEAKEVVMVTPCNHMFHEDCILPWVKSRGRCPVCRFSFCQGTEDIEPLSTNNNNLISSTTIEPFWF